MSIFNKLFGKKKNQFIIPSNQTAEEFGKVNLRNVNNEWKIDFTILMEPQGKETEGWQTGIALDASTSMRAAYGAEVKGKIPLNAEQEYKSNGWITKTTKDGRTGKVFTRAAVNDAISKDYLKMTNNIVQPLAREFIAYPASKLDANGGTTVIYWACEDGSAYEVIGKFTDAECQNLIIEGPSTLSYGSKTILQPAVQYFVDQFSDAKRGMYVFVTDGIIDDLESVKQYTTKLAVEIKDGVRNPIKCVLIGVGDQINQKQMEELENLDTGTDIDIWDHKIVTEMSALVEIFAEVVSENQIVAPVGIITTESGTIIRKYTDGLPAKVKFSIPTTEKSFAVEIAGRKIVQAIPMNIIPKED
jgi:hypothetical protein